MADYARRHHLHRVQGAGRPEERRGGLRPSARSLVRLAAKHHNRFPVQSPRPRRYIRESAVVLVVRILKRYGAAYPTLIPRTMRTLLHALLDPSKVLLLLLLLLLAAAAAIGVLSSVFCS
jgi:hypothetical protein